MQPEEESPLEDRIQSSADPSVTVFLPGDNKVHLCTTELLRSAMAEVENEWFFSPHNVVAMVDAYAAHGCDEDYIEARVEEIVELEEREKEQALFVFLHGLLAISNVHHARRTLTAFLSVPAASSLSRMIDSAASAFPPRGVLNFRKWSGFLIAKLPEWFVDTIISRAFRGLFAAEWQSVLIDPGSNWKLYTDRVLVVTETTTALAAAG